MSSSGELARRVIAKLDDAGYPSYLVGGCVRDLLLGSEPKDYDVATPATPDEVLALYPHAQKVGAHFGVILIREGPAQVEVATFRSEGPYRDGRHPSHVKFETDPRQDVLRRDFTVNALLLDTRTDRVLDYVGGRADLEDRLIRAIGDPEKRFREDHLRMLRALRFAARLGFDIDPQTESAIVRLHPLICDVSTERVRDEIVRILTEGSARRGFELLDRTHLLTMILPEIAAMKDVPQPPEFHPEGDVWVHTLMMLEQLPAGVSPTLALGVLLHDVGKPGTFRVADRIRFDGHVELGVEITHRILTRLRFSHDQIRQVETLVQNHMRFKDVPNMKESTIKRFFRLPAFEEHLELHRLDCISSHGMLGNYDFARERYAELGQERIKPPRLLSGDDLIQAGYTPGPLFGRVLAAVEDAQLEGTVRTKEEALELALEMLESDSIRNRSPLAQTSIASHHDVMKITSTAFSEGGNIPSKYTCDGENVSPPLAWEGDPEKTASFALIVHDPDAPAGDWVHWVLFQLPANLTELPEHIPPVETLLNGSVQGRNDFKKIGYGGPCPPGGTHRYYFRLYALDRVLPLRGGATRQDVDKAMYGHILAEASLMGTYQRKK